MSDNFPRPFKTLFVSGWDIDRGAVTKEGIVRVSDSDNPKGSVVIADCVIRDTLHGPFIDPDSDEEIALTIVCVCILSREDVREEIDL